MKLWRRAATLTALAAALAVWWLGGRDPRQLAREREAELEAELASGAYSIHPAELLELMQNTSLRLRLLDLRDENEFNLFHIQDARRAATDDLLQKDFLARLGRDAVVVLISNGESRTREAWKLLRAQRLGRVYLLQGGIHGWLQLFAPQRLQPASTGDCPDDECRRYRFEAALGERHPESAPDPKGIQDLKFPRRVKVEASQKRRAGSCG